MNHFNNVKIIGQISCPDLDIPALSDWQPTNSEANLHSEVGWMAMHEAPSRAGHLHLQDGEMDGEVKAVEIDGFFGRNIFRVTDNVMAPEILVGDHLLCTPMEMDSIPNGSLGVVRLDDALLLRRLHFVDGVVLLSGRHKENELKSTDGEVSEVWKVENKLTLGQLQRGSTTEDRTAYLEQHIEKLRSQLNELIKKLGGLDDPKKDKWDGLQ